MTATDTRVALLRSELLRDFQSVEKHGERAGSVDPAAGEAQAAFVAVALDHGYQAFETLLLRLERGLDLPERTGESWHRALLGAAALPLPGIRPPLYPMHATGDWEELLRFRHFFRHAYDVSLDPERLATNARRLARAATATRPFIDAVLAALVLPE